MLNEVVTTSLGLIVGLLTGYYFEWRNSRSTRAQNVELEAKLRRLQESIYSVNVRDANVSQSNSSDALETQLWRWLQEYQGPDGTVGHIRVVERFSSLGFTAKEVNAALSQLNAQGHVTLGEEILVR